MSEFGPAMEKHTSPIAGNGEDDELEMVTSFLASNLRISPSTAAEAVRENAYFLAGKILAS